MAIICRKCTRRNTGGSAWEFMSRKDFSDTMYKIRYGITGVPQLTTCPQCASYEASKRSSERRMSRVNLH
jgi:hypothetical protein